MKRFTLYAAFGAMFVVMIACQTANQVVPTSLPSSLPATALVSTPPPTLTPLELLATPVQESPPPITNTILQLCIDDLVNRLKIGAAEINVVKVEATDWPDASLGCPKEGVAYIQVITPGYRITLEAGGKQYDYHTDAVKRVLLCRNAP